MPGSLAHWVFMGSQKSSYTGSGRAMWCASFHWILSSAAQLGMIRGAQPAGTTATVLVRKPCQEPWDIGCSALCGVFPDKKLLRGKEMNMRCAKIISSSQRTDACILCDTGLAVREGKRLQCKAWYLPSPITVLCLWADQTGCLGMSTSPAVLPIHSSASHVRLPGYESNNKYLGFLIAFCGCSESPWTYLNLHLTPKPIPGHTILVQTVLVQPGVQCWRMWAQDGILTFQVPACDSCLCSEVFHF